jgi:8-oxo-dGTP pyrophosphatase MutT (NUDIX family)
VNSAVILFSLASPPQDRKEMAMSEPLTFIPAATVVIFRHAANGGPPELLMVQRAKEMRFAGGAAVFPGGRIDEADRVLAAALAPETDPDLTAARIAAVRETLEETGLAVAITSRVSADEARAARALLLEQGTLAPVLERFGWKLDLAALVPFARWCPQWDGAFDTRFFLADLGTGVVDITVDATENTRLFWASAVQALAMADGGETSVIFPTRRNLERLAQFASFAEARDHAAATPIRTISPLRQERGGETYLTIPEGLGYPVTAQPMSTVRRG